MLKSRSGHNWSHVTKLVDLQLGGIMSGRARNWDFAVRHIRGGGEGVRFRWIKGVWCVRST